MDGRERTTSAWPVADRPAPRVGLLDGFRIETACPGRTVRRDVVPPAVQRLVACVCFAGRPGRSAVAGQLWGDVSEDQAQASLRSALWRLGRLAPGLLDTAGGALALAPGVRADVRELADWAATVRDPRTPLDDLTLPRPDLDGDLLPGWHDDWVLIERERLRQLRLYALETLGARLAAAGRPAEAVEAALAAVRSEPLRESAHRLLVRVHLAEGDVAAAVRTYRHFRTMLRDELGLDPSDRFTRLVQHLGGGGRVAS
ncbi:DNA-binding transcriptional activator of the SARP family [Geodermatophilus africanus]|uniref:DNA-binding transcriptional activator of the SARP family n=1 Tax=Geodermatophilus africanus TaxID=1137993 RepID=A0A1H3ANG7_9ACTN|nr:BTAD domain-containing putative transcriptional regulator [Geodermatophilus africanus]SDX30389.1 DNA-binding transcriptional activator of the SARP family [Geodermatophilus africanus]